MFKIGRLNKIKLTRGDDADFIVKLFNGDKQISIDGTLTMTVRKTPEGTLLFSIESDEEGYFIINHDLTAEADTGLYVYDLKYTDEEGNIQTVIYADFELTDEVTYARD